MAQLPVELILVRQLAHGLAVPTFVVDAAGDRVFVNEAAEALLGLDFEDVGQVSFADWTTAFASRTKGRQRADPATHPLAVAIRKRTPVHGPLRTRLTRYLSPPLFPVRIRDLDARVVLHDAPEEPVSIGGFEVVAQHVIHPGPTVGYRISADGASVAYLPDHEPALGARQFPEEPRWTSGFDLASGVDLLIHDGQYSDDERAGRIGWGHSSVNEAVAFAELARVRRLILFHHDPSHSDAVLDELTEAARAGGTSIEVVAGREGAQYDLGTGVHA